MDTHNISDINTTKEERESLHIGDIYSNCVKCLSCGWYLRSKNRHDFVQCNCENETFVDGGSWYVHCGGMDMDLVEIRTVYYNDAKELKENT